MSLTIRLHISTHPNFLGQPKFHQNPTKILPKYIYQTNPLRPLVQNHTKMSSISTQKTQSKRVIKSSLIDPDGGSLIDLIVPENERDLRVSEAELLPKIRLTKIDLEWVHVLSEGWASPLKGFMRENEYLQSLHFNSLRMQDGSVTNMSLPIVLAIDDKAKDDIGSSPDVALVGPGGDLVAILRRFASYPCFRS